MSGTEDGDTRLVSTKIGPFSTVVLTGSNDLSSKALDEISHNADWDLHPSLVRSITIENQNRLWPGPMTVTVGDDPDSALVANAITDNDGTFDLSILKASPDEGSRDSGGGFSMPRHRIAEGLSRPFDDSKLAKQIQQASPITRNGLASDILYLLGSHSMGYNLPSNRQPDCVTSYLTFEHFEHSSPCNGASLVASNGDTANTMTVIKFPDPECPANVMTVYCVSTDVNSDVEDASNRQLDSQQVLPPSTVCLASSAGSFLSEAPLASQPAHINCRDIDNVMAHVWQGVQGTSTPNAATALNHRDPKITPKDVQILKDSIMTSDHVNFFDSDQHHTLSRPQSWFNPQYIASVLTGLPPQFSKLPPSTSYGAPQPSNAPTAANLTYLPSSTADSRLASTAPLARNHRATESRQHSGQGSLGEAGDDTNESTRDETKKVPVYHLVRRMISNGQEPPPE